MEKNYRIYYRANSVDVTFSDHVYSHEAKDCIFEEIVFIQAPSSEKLEQYIKGVKVGGDKDNCVKFRKLDSIKMNVRSAFWAGDPIKFVGTAICEVNLNGDVTGRFLKIKVWQLPDTYVYVYINCEDKLALRQKVLKK